MDGTLVDSLRDIAESLNGCLALLGLPGYEVSAYRYLVGEGIVTLCQRAIGQTHPYLVGRLVELARPRYRLNCLVHTRPYEGVSDLVGRLCEDGMRLAVLSNKPHEMTLRIVRHFWPNGEFAAIQGYDHEAHRKPSPHHALAICERLGVPMHKALLIGDTPTDVQTARNARAGICAVTWGFRTRDDLSAAGADWLIDHPLELHAALFSAG